MVTYCKYSNKRTRNTKLAWIFFTASAEIFEVYLKYNEQTSEKYQACLDIFIASASIFVVLDKI